MSRGSRRGGRGMSGRVDPAGKANRRPFGGTNRKPRTEAPIPRFRAQMARNVSPVGLGRRGRGRLRRHRRGRGRR